jgi:hypothetical protein
MEKTHCSSPELYTSYRSCWLTILVVPINVFGEAILQTSKIHNLFIQYPNNTYFSCVGILLKMGRRPIIFFIILIIVNSVSS